MSKEGIEGPANRTRRQNENVSTVSGGFKNAKGCNNCPVHGAVFTLSL